MTVGSGIDSVFVCPAGGLLSATTAAGIPPAGWLAASRACSGSFSDA